MKNVLDVFAEKTGLKIGEDFVYTQHGGSGYCGLCVIKNGKFFEIGDFSYAAFIRNEFNDLRNEDSKKMMNLFVEMAIDFKNGLIENKPPILYGNHYFNIKGYKHLISFDVAKLKETEKHLSSYISA